MYDVYVTGTANGQRPLIMLEECGQAYRKHYLDRTRGDQRHPDYLAVNPLGALPALIDPAPAGGGAPLTVTQSVAILFYLADKHGQLLPTAPRARALAIESAMLAATDVAGTATQIFITDHRLPAEDASKAWLAEFHPGRMRKYLGDCERRIAENGGWLAGSYSMADIILFSTMNRPDFRKYVQELPALRDWHARILERPAVQRGLAAATP